MEKNYLYHGVPKNMKGNTLHPLNYFKEKDPELYATYAKKYIGREERMETTIPTLEGCRWNDVLHLSAVHPEELKKALLESGMKIEDLKNMKFYQIDPEVLPTEKTTVYITKQISTEKGREYPEEFVEYDPNNLEKHKIIPDFTKEYYKKMLGEDKTPLMFLGVPHIFHKGSINISDFPVITV